MSGCAAVIDLDALAAHVRQFWSGAAKCDRECVLFTLGCDVGRDLAAVVSLPAISFAAVLARHLALGSLALLPSTLVPTVSLNMPLAVAVQTLDRCICSHREYGVGGVWLRELPVVRLFAHRKDNIFGHQGVASETSRSREHREQRAV